MDHQLHRIRPIRRQTGKPLINPTLSNLQRALLRIVLLLMLAAAGSGCGVKLAYNNLDRIARWSMDDYMDLDPAQQKYFETELEALLYWHRTTQLPLYAKAVRQLDVELADGASVEELFVFRSEVDGWWRAILEASLPASTQLMYSATDAQLDQFATQYAKDVAKYVKPYERLSPEKRRKRWARDVRDFFEYFSGNLNDAQKQLIVAQSGRFVPDDQSWADYRRRYGAALVALVRERQPYVAFSRAFRDMSMGTKRWYGAEYTSALASNQVLYRDLTIALIDSLTAPQRRQLSKRLDSLATDFEELAADAPPVAPPAACLVSC